MTTIPSPSHTMLEAATDLETYASHPLMPLCMICQGSSARHFPECTITRLRTEAAKLDAAPDPLQIRREALEEADHLIEVNYAKAIRALIHKERAPAECGKAPLRTGEGERG